MEHHVEDRIIGMLLAEERYTFADKNLMAEIALKSIEYYKQMEVDDE